jgi:hypothetical protein
VEDLLDAYIRVTDLKTMIWICWPSFMVERSPSRISPQILLSQRKPKVLQSRLLDSGTITPILAATG